MVSKSTGKKDIAVKEEFYDWIIDKKQGKEKAIEDTLRRLLKYKKRQVKK